jgi:hypothetical protein
MLTAEFWSGRADLNCRPLAPQARKNQMRAKGLESTAYAMFLPNPNSKARCQSPQGNCPVFRARVSQNETPLSWAFPTHSVDVDLHARCRDIRFSVAHHKQPFINCPLLEAVKAPLGSE